MEKTPFISTSSRLIWIIQLLIKGLKNGNETGRLSVIDASALDQRTVFHARPVGGLNIRRPEISKLIDLQFHDAVKKTHAFSNGAWHYPGTYEVSYILSIILQRQRLITLVIAVSSVAKGKSTSHKTYGSPLIVKFRYHVVRSYTHSRQETSSSWPRTTMPFAPPCASTFSGYQTKASPRRRCQCSMMEASNSRPILQQG